MHVAYVDESAFGGKAFFACAGDMTAKLRAPPSANAV